MIRRLHSILWVTIFVGFFALVGFLLCIIPGIDLWISFTVALPVLLTERTKGRRAISRSRKLVEGRWWSVFAVVPVADYPVEKWPR